MTTYILLHYFDRLYYVPIVMVRALIKSKMPVRFGRARPPISSKQAISLLVGRAPFVDTKLQRFSEYPNFAESFFQGTKKPHLSQ